MSEINTSQFDISDDKFAVSLIRQQNTNLLQLNFTMNQKITKLEAENQMLSANFQNLISQMKEMESEYKGELDIAQTTIDYLKDIIKHSDKEHKQAETEIFELKEKLDENSSVEKTIGDLKANISQVQEERELETEAIREQIELLLEELRDVKHERDELDSQNRLYEDAITNFKKTIASLRNELEMSKIQNNSNHFIEDSRVSDESFRLVNCSIDDKVDE